MFIYSYAFDAAIYLFLIQEFGDINLTFFSLLVKAFLVRGTVVSDAIHDGLTHKFIFVLALFNLSFLQLLFIQYGLLKV